MHTQQGGGFLYGAAVAVDQLALELGNASKHRQHHAAGRAGIEKAYDEEVLVGFVRLRLAEVMRQRAQQAQRFAQASTEACATIAAQLAAMARGAERMAIWGGTGRAAAFIHHYGVDAARFALVIDSDPDKIGSYVPGTGQRIQSPQVLIEHPVQVIIIPSQWRAADIVAEMAQRGIRAERILIEHDGRLIDYTREAHPYRRA